MVASQIYSYWEKHFHITVLLDFHKIVKQADINPILKLSKLTPRNVKGLFISAEEKEERREEN